MGIECDSLGPLLGPLEQGLRSARLTIAAAESCTGGMVAAALTDRPGSSDYFLGGVVAYANEAKTRLLGVPPEMLDRFGAVSAEVAEMMAARVREIFLADVAVSVTGIAGPGGAEAGKPVGLTYIAACLHDISVVREFRWSGGRASNRAASVGAAFALAIELLSAPTHKTV
ncbi:MAG: CinA family protein [Candidatus Dormibacteria bacterium]